MMAGVTFLGLAYLLVYVGAVSILFLFILMLINIRVSELATETSNAMPLAILIGIFFSSTSVNTYPHTNLIANGYVYNSRQKPVTIIDIDNVGYSFKEVVNLFEEENKVSYSTSGSWDGNLSETSHIATIGNIIYTSYPMWLIITSIILLLAMVGSIVITIRQKNES